MRRVSANSHDRQCITLAFSLLLCGCGKEAAKPPQTFPVTGEVRYEGGELIAKGVIQFQSEDNPALNVSGPIADGKFSIVTSFGNTALPGTMAGRYWVSVTPAFESIPKTIQLREPFEIRSEPTHLDISVPPLPK